MKIYLIRHGETPWNREKRFQGQIDIPLNEYGRRIAEETRQGLPVVHFDKVFSSPLCRARETAEILLRDMPDIPVETDERLKEFGFGPYEGCSITAVANDPAHPLYNCIWHPDLYKAPAGAESFVDLIRRAQDFIRERILPLESTSCRNVLVTAHGAFNRAFVIAAGHKGVADFWSVPYLNCAVTVLELSGGCFKLLEEAKIYYTPVPA